MDKRITPGILKELLILLNKGNDKAAIQIFSQMMIKLYGLASVWQISIFTNAVQKEGYCYKEHGALFLTDKGRAYIGR